MGPQPSQNAMGHVYIFKAILTQVRVHIRWGPYPMSHRIWTPHKKWNPGG